VAERQRPRASYYNYHWLGTGARGCPLLARVASKLSHSGAMPLVCIARKIFCSLLALSKTLGSLRRHSPSDIGAAVLTWATVAKLGKKWTCFPLPGPHSGCGRNNEQNPLQKHLEGAVGPAGTRPTSAAVLFGLACLRADASARRALCHID
jgi:hypothetical protein